MSELTVVITINDDDLFKKDRDRIFDSLKNFDHENPSKNWVAAISNDNEIYRMHLIREALELDDSEWARECANFILNHNDISSIKNFNEVLRIMES